jgi:Bacteriorhodopsin-like protein
MNTKSFFYSTLVASVIVQIITGIIEIGTALFASVSPEFNIIRQLLFLEIAVQAIEGLFYVWLLLNFASVINVTPKRYIDWSITTPTMLITLMFYLIFLERREKNEDTTGLNFFDLAIENGKTISNVFILNWAMLFFGYLGEMNIVSTLTGVLLGFVPFLLYYYIIYQKYAIGSSSTGNKIFWYFFIFWSLYGVVALLPYYLKNGLYNILDLFAKNFFGLFLSYIILLKKY